MSTQESGKSGIDLLGAGEVAQAIPPEVYIQTAATVLSTFESLVAPITSTTEGLGRLIRQTFDNWVEVRKAIGTYTLQQALLRAKIRAEEEHRVLKPPYHPKTFLRALDEGSLETDSVMHKMWVGLLASQLIDCDCHPRFVSILSQLGPGEARLLASLRPRPSGCAKFVGGSDAHSGMNKQWVSASDQSGQPWNLSVTILCQQSLADVSPFVTKAGESRPVLLHLTPFGEEFLAVVALDCEGEGVGH